ncbi:hypothetical protein OC845_004602 [Tilletia horrida]|nr:hypothetical protein OC845_004602 [Tilletia horrida]
MLRTLSRIAVKASCLSRPSVLLGSSRSRSTLAPLTDDEESSLRAQGVPLCGHEQACADCAEPFDEDNPPSYLSKAQLDLWKQQKIDLSPNSLLSTAHPDPFRTHALISTGKTDWIREVSQESGSLAELFRKFVAADRMLDPPPAAQDPGSKLPEGVWTNSSASRVVFNNSSHVSSPQHDASAESGKTHNLMLFPSFQLVTNVPAPVQERGKSNESLLQAIWNLYIRGACERVSEEDKQLVKDQKVKRWTLPYRAVVLICSHQERDARCGIAASLLASSLRHHAEAAGWKVDERGDTVPRSPSETSTPARRELSDANLSHDGAQSRAQDAQGKGTDDDNENTLGIFRISHIGGHKFAGNVIVYFPSGAGLWYGRVSPVRDAKLLFEKTIVQGTVIPEFLRAGINLAKLPAASSTKGEA